MPAAHGLTKEAAIPASDIKQALIRKTAIPADPAVHNYTGEIENA